MSCKITIELNGHTEQALLPVIHQAAKRYPALQASEKTSLYRENPALFQQQIQQLIIQNRLLQDQLLQDQLASSAEPLPPAPDVKALPQPNGAVPASASARLFHSKERFE